VQTGIEVRPVSAHTWEVYAVQYTLDPMHGSIETARIRLGDIHGGPDKYTAYRDSGARAGRAKSLEAAAHALVTTVTRVFHQ
jgi:hypothetical protein